ncbi:PF12395 family protein [Leptospira alstonii serovar Pingchang str. 80-412]|uniref:PF12395 family protein n=2 Tax=Leptospira alstonii TaxID=28452 RepID=M6CT94_9LEPT|nr:PF12395 family protein [Leptospira alstonii serovar Sichuan str. 79601]EQA80646.1 PF12395 family protein [Leptospira alstonii serovar Pingchang str. 80-412]
MVHGPLFDWRKRSLYFKQIYCYEEVWDSPDKDWRKVRKKIDALRIQTIVLWYTDMNHDRIFLRMACRYLQEIHLPVAIVNISSEQDPTGATLEDQGFVQRFENRVLLSIAKKDEYAKEFDRIQDRSDEIRRYEGDKIGYLPVDFYDNYVLSFVSENWKRAVRIVGNCLYHQYSLDLSDEFFEWRIRTLIQSGRLEAEGDLSSMQGYNIRRKIADPNSQNSR